MGGLMSNRQMFVVAVVLGFISGFAWVSSTQSLMTGNTVTYSTTD
jgi:hypothetical protein